MLVLCCQGAVRTAREFRKSAQQVRPHEKLLGILRVSNPATMQDLADRAWGGSGTNPK